MTRAAAVVALVVATIAAPGTVAAGDAMRNPLAVPQPTGAPDEALLLVEIPAGGSMEYETRDDGLLFVDRFPGVPVLARG